MPEGTVADGSAMVISDNGNGMSYGDMADKYLRTGRKRRDKDDGGDRTPGYGRAMGRKGIGKLSVFGMAKDVEVRRSETAGSRPRNASRPCIFP